MAKLVELRKISKEFYKVYPHSKYPEMEAKENRPYGGNRLNTLKCYEKGRKKLPFEIYFMLVQILKLDISIVQMK